MAQLEEGIKQSYNEIFGRNPSQDEINEYVEEFGGDGTYDTLEEEDLEQRLYNAASAEQQGIANPYLQQIQEGAKQFEEQKIVDAEEEIKKDLGIDNLVSSEEIENLYKTELGPDRPPPTEAEIQYYQRSYGETLDPREIRQFRTTPEAVEYRQGFDRAFQPLYEDLFRTSPTDQDIAEGRERFGDLITPDEVNRFIRDRETVAKVQSGIRSGLGIPTLDFSNFNKAPVTTGPTATAGIERLRPTDTTGTMAGVFANPQFTAPDYSKFGAEMPNTFKTFSDLVSENIRQDAYRKGLEAAADVTGQQIVDPTQQAMIQELAEAEGNLTPMRTGGIASLGYRRGGGVMEDGVMRYGLGGEIRKLYKGVKRICLLYTSPSPRDS